MIIDLKHVEIENCLNFAKNAAFNHNGHSFGAWDQPERSYEEIVRDIFVGKIGEVAFQHFLIKNKIEVFTNFIVFEPQ